MIKIEQVETYGWEAAIRGMRNPLESWDKSDSFAGPADIDGKYSYILGENDLDLATRLANAGSDHGKFLRQIFVSMDITAPLFWWKEFDTYKVGTVANSTSTMHTISKHPITFDNFSFDTLMKGEDAQEAMCDMFTIIHICEHYRKKYLEYKDEDKKRAEGYWRMLIELLPCGWLQKRTVTLNYENARNMHRARHNHKLKEWHGFCDIIKTLPYANELIIGKTEEKDNESKNS